MKYCKSFFIIIISVVLLGAPANAERSIDGLCIDVTQVDIIDVPDEEIIHLFRERDDILERYKRNFETSDNVSEMEAQLDDLLEELVRYERLISASISNNMSEEERGVEERRLAKIIASLDRGSVLNPPSPLESSAEKSDCGCGEGISAEKASSVSANASFEPPTTSRFTPEEKERKQKQVLEMSLETGEFTIRDKVVGDMSDGKGKHWQGDGMFAQFSPSQEVIEMRNEFTKTFRITDEDFKAVICAGPVHYMDEDGAWQDIVAEFSDAGDAFVSGENVFSTRFPKASTERYSIENPKGRLSFGYFENMRIENGDYMPIAEVQAPRRTGRLRDGEIVFADVSGFGHEVVRINETNIQHDLILDELPEIASSLPPDAKYLAIDQSVSIPPDCHIFIPPDHSTVAGKKVVALNSEGKLIAEIPLPLIYEMDDRVVFEDGDKGTSEAIYRERTIGDFRLTESGGEYVLTTLVPLDWLTDSDRNFPVVIDPTITCYIFTTPGDATCSGFSEGTNCYCGYDYCGDVVAATGNNVNLGWMFFNVGGIPDGYIINSVNWNAYCYTRNWPYWELRAMSQRTFDCPSYRSSCTGGTVMLTQSWASTEPTGWKSYNLNASGVTVLQSRIADGWFGTGLRDTDGSDSYYIGFYGFAMSQRPYLVVDYTAVSCGTTNHGGDNFAISSNTSLGGIHTNINTFRVNSGVTVTVAGVCNSLTIEANTIEIYGTIDANGAGAGGGGGGSGGNYSFGYSGSSSHIVSGAGQGGLAGGHTGGGLAGGTGGSGGCHQTLKCGGFLCIGNRNGYLSGGGGRAGGGGGSYGGTGGYGGYSAAGSGWSGAMGDWASGGAGGSTYGNTTDYNVTYGSGGGGAGGGAGGWFNGGSGEGGGRGGGAVILKATGNLTMSGSIYANGTNGGRAGNGGGSSTSGAFTCSPGGYNGCSICSEDWHDASGGAGGGGGGGSGGGISLMAGGTMNVTGTLQARGGTGGTAGSPTPSNGSCFDFPRGGGGGGGGRIKIIQNSCVANTISPTVNRSGGSGGSGYVTGATGGIGTYNVLNIPTVTIETDPPGLEVEVDGITYLAPVTLCWLPGSSHTIGAPSPQSAGLYRYIWSSWSDGGARVHNVTAPSSGTRTYTAYFNEQYLLVFEAQTIVGSPMTSSNYATVTLDGSPHNIWDGNRYSAWVSSGSSHSYSYSETSSGSGASHRWFSESPPSGTASSPDTIRGYYREQWWFDIDENGHSSPCSFREGWYDHGTISYGCVNDSIVMVGSTRYVFDYWDRDATGTNSSRSNNVTMNAAKVARANWRSDYIVTFRAQTMTAGTNLSSSNYVTLTVDGTSYQLWDGHEVTFYFATGTTHSYSYSMTSSSSGIGHRWFAPSPPSGTVSSAATITGNYYEQWWFNIDPGGHSSACAGRIGWHNHGSTVSACVNDSIIVAGDTRYIFDAWTGHATGSNASASDPVTMDAAKTAVATWRTEYRLSLAYDGTGPAIPAQTGAGWYSAGTNAPITTEDPIFDGLMRRYDFEDWTGGSFANPLNPATTILMDAPRTATANYRLAQVTVTVQTDGTADSVIVDGAREVSPHTVVWLTGSSHTISTDSIQYGPAGVRYIFAGWADGVSSRTRTIAPVTDSTFTAIFHTQYYLTVEDGGHGSVTGEGWYFSGTITSFSSTEIADETGRERWVFDHWEGTGAGSYTGTDNPGICTMLEPITQTAVWLKQYKIAIDDGGYGTATPPPGSYWFYEDSIQTAHITSPDTVARTYCTGWIGTGSVPASGADTTVTWTVDDSGTVEWQWEPQLTLIVESEYPGIVPEGTTYYDPGTDITATAPEDTVYIAPGHRAILLGWTATGSAPSSGTTGVIDFVITENTTITWQWRTEYLLTINNPGGYGSPDPPAGDYWCVRDTSIIAWVTSPDGSYYCLGYHGTGSVPLYSPSTYAWFTMTMPSTLTWDWEDYAGAMSLTITSPTDSTSPPPGTYWYRLGSTVTCSTLSDTVFYPFRTDMRWILEGWTGTGSCPAEGDSGLVSFPLHTYSNLHWHWQQQVKVVVESDGGMGSPVPPPGEHWFNIGDTVTFSVTSPEGDFWCIGWDGTGSIGDGILDHFTAVIDSPSTVTWLWSDDIAQLMVHSDWGEPHPPVGLTNYLSGTAVECTVNAHVPLDPGRRMANTGWTGVGVGIPPTGSTNYVAWNIVGYTELFWNFKPEVSLNVTSAHGAPSPPVGTTWFDSSATIEASVTSPVGDWYCVGWEGTGSAPSGYGTEFTFDLDDPSTIDWIWERDVAGVCTLIVYSPYGTPWPSGIHVVPVGTFIRATVEDSVLVGGLWQHCTGWAGTGSVPATGGTNISEFTITENSTLTWIWNGELRWPLTVVSMSGLGDPEPSVGLHWVPDDTTITFNVSSPSGGHICTGWEGTGSVPDFGYDTTFTATIGMASRVTWQWSEMGDVVTLTVTSDFGNPEPHRGVTYHPIGRHITAVVEDTIHAGEGIMRLCSGWRGTGSVPTGGDGNVVEFTITANSTLEWRWVNNYFIGLSYIDCGTGVPYQEGQGWYIQGETADISTDSLVVADDVYYIFDHWDAILSLPDTHLASFDVDSTYHIKAVYTPGARATIRKEPPHTEGYIEVDGHRFYDVEELSLWWVIGSHHNVSVSTPDTTATVRHTFNRWMDGPPTPARSVGPVLGDTTITAFYNRQFLVRIEKSPAENVYGNIGFTTPPPVGFEAERWVNDGDSLVFAASDTDWTPTDTDRYIFQSWSDGGPRIHGKRIFAPETLLAIYQAQRKWVLRKDPLQSYGWVTMGDSTCYGCNGMIRWMIDGYPFWAEVSPMDITTDSDSVYYFREWSDGGAIGHTVGPIDSWGLIVAHYDPVDVNLAVCVDTNSINLGIMNLGQIVTTDASQVIRVENCGDIAATWGLYISYPGIAWSPGIGPAFDKFVLRGIFNEEITTEPTTFDPIHDYIRSSLIWSSPHYFGPDGWNIPVDDVRSLWLQFHAPTGSSIFSTHRLVLTIMAKIHMP